MFDREIITTLLVIIRDNNFAPSAVRQMSLLRVARRARAVYGTPHAHAVNYSVGVRVLRGSGRGVGAGSR